MLFRSSGFILNNTKIKIIHGYGSNGEGGKIKKCIRNYLKDNKEYFLTITGEEIDLNQGYTIITIKKSLQDMDSMLENEIIRFCELAKSNEKIVGKLRKYGEKNEYELLVDRISTRITESKQTPHYYGRKITKEEAINILKS